MLRELAEIGFRVNLMPIYYLSCKEMTIIDFCFCIFLFFVDADGIEIYACFPSLFYFMYLGFSFVSVVK